MKQYLILLLFLVLLCQNLSAQYDVHYENSFNTLNEMLLDSSKYNFKKAVFSVENAYNKGMMGTIFLNKKIENLKLLANKLVESRTLKYQGKDRDVVAKYAALFSVLNDSIPIQDGQGNSFYYEPFSYDFDDPFGHEDWSNMFVSKLLKTGKGNCHSLPYLYKILAEELGVEAHLALAPNHLYIKHKNEKDGWYNTELTSGIFPIDAWLMASGYIHTDAIRNGVFMKALGDKESIALCLVDLAQAYQREEFYDVNFVIKCANKALEYYPNYVNAMILKTEAKGKKIENILLRHNTDFKDANNIPETRELLAEVQIELTKIYELGYRQMPEEMYLNWLVSLKEEREKYSNQNINSFNVTD